MKTVAIILTLISIAKSQSFGYYKFYKNFGGGFYDYGAGVYHAYNGSTPGPDEDDGLCTDRGVYLNGSNTYVTLHSDTWTSSPILSLPFEVNIWAMGFLWKTPLFYRYFDDNSEYNRFYLTVSSRVRNDFFVTSDSGITSESVYTRSKQGLVTLGGWYFYKLVYKQESSFKVTIEVNGVEIANYSSASYTYLEQYTGTTLLGKSTTYQFHGFFYMANFFQHGSFDFNTYFTSVCTPVIDSCDFCPYGECLSTSSEPLENNYGQICTDFGCTGGCDSDEKCFDCPYEDWPICDTSSAIPDLCDSSCTGCVGPLSSDCLECSNPLLGVSSPPGPCQCLSEDLFDCGLCSSNCVSCRESNMCDLCRDSLAVPKTDNSGQCECPPGTFFDSSCKSKFYLVCHPDCTECSEENFCSSCAVEGAVPNTLDSGCSCPLNSFPQNGSCLCDPSYFNSSNSDGIECEKCNPDCLSCDTSSMCLTCKDLEKTPNSEGGCSCPSGLVEEEGSCVCEIGYYKKGQECIKCMEDCSECREEGCLKCDFQNFKVDQDGYCFCPDNFVLNILDENSLQCQCEEGYFETEQEECEECKAECSACLEENYCLSCKHENAILEEGECKCPSNAVLNETVCVCKEGYEPSSSSESLECQKSLVVLDEVFKAFSSAENTAIAAGGIILGSFSVIAGNPINIWSILNTIQILSYVPLFNIAFPSQLQYVTSSFDIKNYIPNMTILILDYNRSPLMVSRPHWKEFTDSSSFFENIGEFITSLLMLITLMLLSLLSVVLFPKCSGFVKRRLHTFKYSAFIRLFLELYLVLLFGSIISFYSVVELGLTDMQDIIGTGAFIACGIFPFVLGFFLYKNMSKVTDFETKKKFGSLFEEFEIIEKCESLFYYPFFLMKRFLYMVSLFYLYEWPSVQIASVISLSFCEIILLKTYFRFENKWKHRLKMFTEVNLLLFFGLMTAFLKQNEDSTQKAVSFIMIGLICAILSVNGLYLLGNSVINHMCRRKRESHSKVIPLGEIEDNKIFSLSRRQNYNANEENNAKKDITNIGP